MYHNFSLTLRKIVFHRHFKTSFSLLFLFLLLTQSIYYNILRTQENIRHRKKTKSFQNIIYLSLIIKKKTHRKVIERGNKLEFSCLKTNFKKKKYQ